MPNNYTPIGVCSPGFNFDIDGFLEQHRDTNFCAVVRPMPEPLEKVQTGYDGQTGKKEWRDDGREPQVIDGHTNWYTWAVEHWGTKWGTYETQAMKLSGDDEPVLICFQSA